MDFLEKDFTPRIAFILELFSTESYSEKPSLFHYTRVRYRFFYFQNRSRIESISCRQCDEMTLNLELSATCRHLNMH